jgi:LAO/AO transport system kinase
MTGGQPGGARPARLRVIADGFRAGEATALAQAITVVEQGGPAVAELLTLLPPRAAATPTVGVTGPPGAGKSTLLDAMVRLLRSRGRTVGVLAVDPSSPFTRGAFLGDRVRMSAHGADPGVFVRSMGARGHSGGLSAAAADAIWLLRSFGFDEVLVETVGVGQSELALRSAVDTTVVLVPPDAGDRIQMAKAGIMEIADVFVVNKGDLPGARSTAGGLRSSVRLRPAGGWRPPVVATVANRPDDSHAALWDAIVAHRHHLAATRAAGDCSAQRAAETVADMVALRARAWARSVLTGDPDARAAVESGMAPYAVAGQLCARLGLPQHGDDLDRSVRRQ